MKTYIMIAMLCMVLVAMGRPRDQSNGDERRSNIDQYVDRDQRRGNVSSSGGRGGDRRIGGLDGLGGLGGLGLGSFLDLFGGG